MKHIKYYILFVLPLLVLFSSCGVKKQFGVNTNSRTTSMASAPSSFPTSVRRDDASSYIERYKGVAIAEMNEYGIPASITLAQGLLESGNGNSILAVQANNHFGIKCTSAWIGKTILKDDDAKDECFRVYKTPEESFRDHSEFLKRKRYAFLFELDRNDYESWANGLKKAGYATNPRYPELLTTLIRRYTLDQYDRKEVPSEKNKRETTMNDRSQNLMNNLAERSLEHPEKQTIDKNYVHDSFTADEKTNYTNENKVISGIAKELPEQRRDNLAKSSVVMKVYEVKTGDTIYSISKRFTLSVGDLKAINNLQDDTVKLGQLLLISK